MMQKRFVALLEWEVRERHHLLRQVRLEAAVHARVNRQAVLVGADGVVVDLEDNIIRN